MTGQMKRTIKSKSTPLQAVGYVRVSSAKQAEEGVSIEAQKEKIKQWIKLNDAKLIDIFEDNGITGKTTNRPGFQEALELVIKEKAVLICYSLSRLSRSTKDMLQIGAKLEKAGAELVSLQEQINTTTAAGKMVFRMLAVLNEFEIDLISERTKSALAYLKKQGKKTGGIVPFGWNVDETGKLHKNPSEQKVIKKIMNLHNGGMKFQTIGNHLNERGITTKTGKRWYAQSVKNVVLANKILDETV